MEKTKDQVKAAKQESSPATDAKPTTSSTTSTSGMSKKPQLTGTKEASKENQSPDEDLAEKCMTFLFILVVMLLAYLSYYLLIQHRSSSPVNSFMKFATNVGGFEGRTKDNAVKLQVDLKDVYMGNTVQIDLMKNMICDACDGTGAEGKTPPVRCNRCYGQGVIERKQRTPFGVMVFQDACNACGGHGEIIQHRCPVCRGNKVRRLNKKISVPVPKGIPEGQPITIEGEADEAPKHKTGDLIIYIHTAPHSTFRRDGANLHTTVTISLLQSLVGFEIDFVHLDGHTVKISKKTITPHGEVLTIKGEGMPSYGWQTSTGDLYITFAIEFPEYLDMSDREDLIGIFGKDQLLNTNMN
eukprot:TRINITY_DN2081_c0_g1_i1.p1 TRINITY_DN2081_c0_g1~~TRINITY_DN2081_c0_g1_i1.p1  ORF type:complete len:355 (+),score=77.30 TRINITY_DN2081_c0_g1_i1:99-1163(+)